MTLFSIMVYFPPTGVDWPFPVQREYMILQLSPVAMVKHLNDPKLLSDLSAIRTRKYLAIFSHVRAAMLFRIQSLTRATQ